MRQAYRKRGSANVSLRKATATRCERGCKKSRGRGSLKKPLILTAIRSLRRHHRHGGVEHAVAEAPFVVVPAQHLDEVAVGHARLRRIEYRAVAVVIEVARHQRLGRVAKDAFPRAALRRLLDD